MKPKMKPTNEKNARLTAAAPVEKRGMRHPEQRKVQQRVGGCPLSHDKTRAQDHRYGYRNPQPRRRGPPLGALDDAEDQRRNRSHR